MLTERLITAHMNVSAEQRGQADFSLLACLKLLKNNVSGLSLGTSLKTKLHGALEFHEDLQSCLTISQSSRIA